MDTKLVDSQAVDLLSNITGQKLSQEDVTPSVIFLAALVALLLGVIYADSQVTEEEKQRLQKTLNKFIPAQGGVRELTKLMVKGVKENLDYTKSTNLLKLTNSFSKPQKLLLLSFGYEMSAADGTIDAREKRYLEVIADWLGVKSTHLAVLEAGFNGQKNVNSAAFSEIKSLLDPAHFRDLDTIFVKAANDILESLFPQFENQQQEAIKTNNSEEKAVSAPSQPPQSQQNQATSYQELAKFNQQKRKLDNLCGQLYNVIRDCCDRNLLPPTLTTEIEKISQKLRSQRFRLAVVGEFSQGKSTLLNALLREEIQPVRAIPCSGTITVLKYGTQKRVVCRYKDGREEEIPFEQYKEKAAIPKKAAQEHRNDEHFCSDIDEIIFEHPDLDLCRNGVEILDSPGLNEHPARTAITQKLLKDTDAAIFLTNASRLLPEREKELIQDVRNQLNGGKENQPAENLFVLVNFMDLLEEEEDRQDVKHRLESFVKDNSLLTANDSRIHYISAKATLKSILHKTEDEHLVNFQKFTQSVENFLTVDRGNLKIKQSVEAIQLVIQESLTTLQQAEAALDGKINLSEAERRKILEQIGEASGKDVKIQLLANKLLDEVREPVHKSWNQWVNSLEDRLRKKSEKWTSENSPIWSRDALARDFASQFNDDLAAELDIWITHQLQARILKEPLETLDSDIEQHLTTILSGLQSLNRQINTASRNLAYFNEKIATGATAEEWFFSSLGVAGLAVALIPVIVLAGPLMTIIASVGAVVSGGAGAGMMFFGVTNIIKGNVFDFGYQEFKKSKENVFAKIEKMINSLFEQRVTESSETIAKVITYYETLLEQQEKAHQQNLQERELEKTLITQKCQQLEQVQKEIAALLTQATA
ncbi:dynamin family protein [Phormidium sp. LEGE 05292]|uniref:dynamin family protein n=1 Tax=[Phormidium] sp. LEGE 05292 TaxID=767427 RepID=UPI00187DFEDD|nr:dynamin family protein [Phormidium sp. LEGE 05292]MBE9225554.1 dynamin family protein [Phormidium sp. LEGE 05292]